MRKTVGNMYLKILKKILSIISYCTGLRETVTTTTKRMYAERVTHGKYKEASKTFKIFKFETKRSQSRRNISL